MLEYIAIKRYVFNRCNQASNSTLKRKEKENGTHKRTESITGKNTSTS